MLGAILGGMIWVLFFVVLGIGFFGLFDPSLFGVLELIFTWVQPIVVAITLLSLYEGGIPGGVGELRSGIAWVRSHEPDEQLDYDAMPANTILIALELAAVTLSTVGLVLSAFFSMATTVTVVAAFGRALFEPSEIAFAGITASESFSLFLAGAILWQIAMFVEASKLV